MAERQSGRIRAFLAVSVAADVTARLIELRRALAASGAAVRWVRDDGLHATVKFLGSTDASVLDAMRDSLGAALASFGAFDAAVAGVGAFPNARRPRVVWAGLRAAPLSDLAKRVESTATPFGFAPESRPFRGHITLGRVKSPAGGKELEAAIAAHADDALGTSTIAELIAFRSDLRSDGSVYTKLWTIPFVHQSTA